MYNSSHTHTLYYSVYHIIIYITYDRVPGAFYLLVETMAAVSESEND